MIGKLKNYLRTDNIPQDLVSHHHIKWQHFYFALQSDVSVSWMRLWPMGIPENWNWNANDTLQHISRHLCRPYNTWYAVINTCKEDMQYYINISAFCKCRYVVKYRLILSFVYFRMQRCRRLQTSNTWALGKVSISRPQSSYFNHLKSLRPHPLRETCLSSGTQRNSSLWLNVIR